MEGAAGPGEDRAAPSGRLSHLQILRPRPHPLMQEVEPSEQAIQTHTRAGGPWFRERRQRWI